MLTPVGAAVGISVSAVGIDSENHILKGELVPDEVMVELICSELDKIKEDSWLLDGMYTLHAVLGTEYL